MINKRNVKLTFLFYLLSELTVLLKSLIAMAKKEVKLAYLGKYRGGSNLQALLPKDKKINKSNE